MQEMSKIEKKHVLRINYLRGDGMPGIIEQPQKITPHEYEELHKCMKNAKTAQEVLLRVMDSPYELSNDGKGHYRKIKTSSLFNSIGDRIVYIELVEMESRVKEGGIITPEDEDFYTPIMKLPPGYDNWNDPTKQNN